MSHANDLRAMGERLRARQLEAKAELEAEKRAAQCQLEAWLAKRERQWADESKRRAEPADVLPWPKRRTN